MAEDLVFTAISNLFSLYKGEVDLLDFVDDERKKLESNLSAIRSVLQDAEKKRLMDKSNASFNNWLQKLSDAVHELNDILDDCSVEAARDDYEGDRSCAFLGPFHPQKVMFRHSISGRMKAMREWLDFIAKEKDQFNLAETQPDINHSSIPEWRETISDITEDKIFGREEDKEKIVLHLLENAEKSGDPPYVYPIIGIGGLGKTTLAQLVYNDERVTNHFEPKKWICVSENFDMGTLVKAIVESNEIHDRLNILVKKLKDMLRQKRYLIVLDDVWNENVNKWLDLRSILACGSEGSVILVTTRLNKVASIMGTPTVHPYELSTLSDDECWKIIERRAFRRSAIKKTRDLVKIGMQIAKKCRGVPLAAKTLGGLLSFKTDERSWRNIRDSELWRLPGEEGSIMAALRLSYLNLPPQSRRCFSFCAIYPKDHQIEKERLIHLWMANGLISKGRDTNLEMEDLGEEIVDDLYGRSLIQDIERDGDESENIKSFKIHDLLHDLAQSVVGKEVRVLEEPNSEDLSPSTRLISFYRPPKVSEYASLKNCKSLQSLLYLASISCDPLAILSSLRQTRLKALDLSGLNDGWPISREIPPSIGVLKHLRYLNLSRSSIEELPEFIGSLWNLQTLTLYGCVNLKSLPISIGRLKNLRYLSTNGCSRLVSMPQSMGALTSIRTLTHVVVGESKKNEFQLSGLKHLNQLKGKLKIKHLERVRDVKDAEEANLRDKRDLRNLILEWDINMDDKLRDSHSQILEAIGLPSGLRHLTLRLYKGRSFAYWMMKEFSNFTYMRSLRLENCAGCVRLLPWWRLPSLKMLHLSWLLQVRYLIDRGEDSYGGECFSFPSLEVIELTGLTNLEKVISGEEADQVMNDSLMIFPRLSELSMIHCPKLNSFSFGALQRIRYLNLENCETLVLSLSSSSYSLQSLSSLKVLRILSCESLKSFPEQMFQGLSSLQKLIIRDCSELKYLPESFKFLSSLEDLEITDCPELADIWSAILQLTSLQKLSLISLSSECLDATVPGLHVLPALKVLELYDFPNLESLPNWMTHLLSLQELNIRSCRRLTSIPDCIRQLPKLKAIRQTQW